MATNFNNVHRILRVEIARLEKENQRIIVQANSRNIHKEDKDYYLGVAEQNKAHINAAMFTSELLNGYNQMEKETPHD